MSEEKPITKSFLEQKIHEKAVEHWKDDVRRAFSSFRNPLFDKLIITGDLREKLDTGDRATLQSELSGDYSYNEQEAFLRCLCSNYDETKKRTIKKYEQNNTDMILNSLSALGDYLNDDRRYYDGEDFEQSRRSDKQYYREKINRLEGLCDDAAIRLREVASLLEPDEEI